MSIIIPIIPQYVEQMGVTGIWIGIIFAVYSGTRVLTAPFIGRLSDSKGRKPLLSAGLILSVLASLGYIWASNPGQLVLVRFVHGAAGGMIYPIAMSYIGDLSAEGKEGTWMGYFNAIVFTAFGFGPLLGGVLSENFGITVTFATMSGLGFLALLLVGVMLPESKPQQITDKPRIPFRAIASSSMIQGLFSYRLTVEAGWGVYVSFISILAGFRLGLGAFQIGILFATNVLLMSLLMIPFGKIADKVNKKPMIIASGLAAAASLAAMPFAPSFWHLLALNIFAGIVSAAEFPSSSALAVAEGRRFGMASTIAVVTMATSAGMVVGPLMGGAVMDTMDVNTVFYSAAGIITLGVILFFCLTRRNRVDV